MNMLGLDLATAQLKRLFIEEATLLREEAFSMRESDLQVTLQAVSAKLELARSLERMASRL